MHLVDPAHAVAFDHRVAAPEFLEERRAARAVNSRRSHDDRPGRLRLALSLHENAARFRDRFCRRRFIHPRRHPSGRKRRWRKQKCVVPATGGGSSASRPPDKPRDRRVLRRRPTTRNESTASKRSASRQHASSATLPTITRRESRLRRNSAALSSRAHPAGHRVAARHQLVRQRPPDITATDDERPAWHATFR